MNNITPLEVKGKFTRYQSEIEGLSPIELLEFVLDRHPGKVAFSTSLSAEDQVISHLLSEIKKPLKVFTLDTGRMFQETYDLLSITRQRYDQPISTVFPDTNAIEQMVDEKGINLFYDSIENRKQCCHLRKIVPFNRTMEGMEIWITGQRREQSITREETGLIQWDEDLLMIKLSPLIDWSDKQVWDFIHKYKVPYNTLHDKGFPSIGCLPCTRAIQPGEDIRAGRWWWENPEFKGCGLHVKKS